MGTPVSMADKRFEQKRRAAKFIPTKSHIKQVAEEIRSGWTVAERQRRAGILADDDTAWSAPLLAEPTMATPRTRSW